MADGTVEEAPLLYEVFEAEAAPRVGRVEFVMMAKFSAFALLPLLPLLFILGAAVAQHGPHAVNLDLVHVQVITRHGARTPLKALSPMYEAEWLCPDYEISTPSRGQEPDAFARQLYKNVYIDAAEVLPGNCSLGQLTTKGMGQMRRLGAFLKKRYAEEYRLIPREYSEDSVYVRTTDTLRTRQSAEMLILGMYPPEERGPGENVLIPMHMVELAADDLFPNPVRCPNIAVLKSNVIFKSEEYQDSVLKNNVYDKLNEIFQGQRYPSIESLGSVLKCRRAQGLELPLHFDEQVERWVYAVADTSLRLSAAHRDYVKLGIGRFVTRLYNNMLDVVKGTGGTRLRIYSAHDTTLALLLAAFQVFDNPSNHHWPKFASNLVLELYQHKTKRDEYFFRWLYNNVPQDLPGCPGSYCNLSFFGELASTLLPTDDDCEAWGR